MTNKTYFYNANQELCYLVFAIDDENREVHTYEVDAVTQKQLYKGTVQMIDCYDHEHFLDKVASYKQALKDRVAISQQ